MVIAEKEKLLNTDEVAEILKLSPATLRTWRWSGVGPRYFSLPGAKGSVRYRRHDLELWLNGNAIDPSKNKEIHTVTAG